MYILVANLGSTSFKYRLFDLSDERQLARGELDLGEEGKFFPSDAAIARWQEGSHGRAKVVYE